MGFTGGEWMGMPQNTTEHTGASGGCKRMQEAAGKRGRLGESSGAPAIGRHGSHNGSKLSSGAFSDSQEGGVRPEADNLRRNVSASVS